MINLKEVYQFRIMAIIDFRSSFVPTTLTIFVFDDLDLLIFLMLLLKNGPLICFIRIWFLLVTDNIMLTFFYCIFG